MNVSLNIFIRTVYLVIFRFKIQGPGKRGRKKGWLPKEVEWKQGG